MMVAALLAAVSAHASGGLVQVGTGLRPLGLPGTNVVVGGGFRAGPTFGRFTPFAGGTVQWVRGVSDEDSVVVAGANWSALAGVRLDLADLDRLAQPFVSAGALFGFASVQARSDDDDDEAHVDLQVGPGAFAGFGADAKLSPAVRLGLEVGLVVSGGRGTVFVDGEDESASATASWSYADLHVVFRPGKRE